MIEYESLRNSVLNTAEAYANAVVPADMEKEYDDGRTGRYWSVYAGGEWNKTFFSAVEKLYRAKKAELVKGPVLSEAEKARILRNAAIIEAHQNGVSFGKIALAHGISKQRVLQIVKKQGIGQYSTFEEV